MCIWNANAIEFHDDLCDSIGSIVYIELTSIRLVRATSEKNVDSDLISRKEYSGRRLFGNAENAHKFQNPHPSSCECVHDPDPWGDFVVCRQKLTISRYSSLSNTRKIFTRQRRVALYLSDASLTTNDDSFCGMCMLRILQRCTPSTSWRAVRAYMKDCCESSCDLKQYKRRTISISVRRQLLRIP